MLKKISFLLPMAALLIAACFSAAPVQAQTINGLPQMAICGPTTATGLQCLIPNADGSFNIIGSFSASGFAPNGTDSTPLAVTTSTGQQALPAASAAVNVFNKGTTNTAFVKLGTSSGVTATVSNIAIPANSGCVLTVGANTNIAAITAAGTATLNINGGAGLGSFCYGGGGGSGGGGAVTVADGADTTLGSKGDAKSAATDTTAITLIQIQKEISFVEQAINTLLGTQADAADCTVNHSLMACQRQSDTDIKGSIPAGTARVGYTSDDPCAQLTKQTAHFSSTSSGGNLVTGTSAKITYLCGISIVASTAAHVSLCEATSTACSGGTPAAVFGNTGVTAANGKSYAANGGEAFGNGLGTVAKTATAAQNIDVLFDTTNSPQVNVDVSYVQQ